MLISFFNILSLNQVHNKNFTFLKNSHNVILYFQRLWDYNLRPRDWKDLKNAYETFHFNRLAQLTQRVPYTCDGWEKFLMLWNLNVTQKIDDFLYSFLKMFDLFNEIHEN